ncbi:hypothetical protein [Bergeyella zoohelcum]|uniref:Uncharacterized protein n=1 Tax=Bergeyella zoohelcum TaxID=1015 RepID=A0A7Z8YMB7_9FLAO|nr:hypothetical protein [Bergeyella zoohelcum]VDH03264.1 Uncharacterised protein [Bergeyella zoohelcum]
MKAQIILCMLGFSSIAYAQQSIYSRHNQQLPTNAVIQENTLQRTFEHLDKSKIETGVLLDAAVEFADLKKYNGILTDSSSTNAKIIGDIYNTLVMGKVSENKGNLMSPADFQNLWFGTQTTDVLPVAGVYFRYNELSEANHWYFKNQQLSPVGRTADISTTTLSISPDNQLRDVYANGVWQNPYDIHTVFAMAPIANSHNKLNFKVIFPQDLFQSNDGNKIAELAVKFSENDTFKVVQYGQEMTVNYPAVGNYQWTYRLTLNDGSVLYSQHPFNITSDLGKYVNTDDTTSRGHTPYRKVELENFQYFIPFPPMVQNRPKLTLYIRYRQGQSQITRPFIVAEGFDAGHITAPRKEGGDNTIEGFLDNLTGDLYYALKNYDIIYVDWGLGQII